MVICIDCGDVGMHDTYGEDEEGAIILCMGCLKKLINENLLEMVEAELVDMKIVDGQPKFTLTKKGEEMRDRSRREHP